MPRVLVCACLLGLWAAPASADERQYECGFTEECLGTEACTEVDYTLSITELRRPVELPEGSPVPMGMITVPEAQITDPSGFLTGWTDKTGVTTRIHKEEARSFAGAWNDRAFLITLNADGWAVAHVQAPLEKSIARYHGSCRKLN